MIQIKEEVMKVNQDVYSEIESFIVEEIELAAQTLSLRCKVFISDDLIESLSELLDLPKGLPSETRERFIMMFVKTVKEKLVEAGYTVHHNFHDFSGYLLEISWKEK
jgi:hypothetical protein